MSTTIVDSPPHNTNAGAIIAGLEFIFSCRSNRGWSAMPPAGECSNAWVTAYVLTRLGEIPASYFNYSLRHKMNEALDWLMDVHISSEGQNEAQRAGEDIYCSAWVAAALRQHGRRIPDSSFEAVRRSNPPDGSSSPDADVRLSDGAATSPEVIAMAIRALGSADHSCVEYLARHLQTALENQPASQLLLASIILDWEPSIVPRLLLQEIRQLIDRQPGKDSAIERALLLRCLLRLRMPAAWSVAADLRRMQQSNGCWHETKLKPRANETLAAGLQTQFDAGGVVATATALSALSMGESQPGLYFGSDLPFRRL